MRIGMLTTAVVLAMSTLVFGCSEEDEDTGDTSVEEVIEDTSAEETE